MYEFSMTQSTIHVLVLLDIKAVVHGLHAKP